MNNFWTVVGFTVKNKFRGKAFSLRQLLLPLLLELVINLPYMISQFSGDDKATQDWLSWKARIRGRFHGSRWAYRRIIKSTGKAGNH